MKNTMLDDNPFSPDYYPDFDDRRNYDELFDAYNEQLDRTAELECRLAELEEQVKQLRH